MGDEVPNAAWEIAVVGGGLAGLSAAIHLGRSRRRTLIINSGRSMAQWEPSVENYLGFPEGLSGQALLDRGRLQARRFGSVMVEDEVLDIRRVNRRFVLQGRRDSYEAQRILLATGLTHLLPDVPGMQDCLGHSVFFCKDCDAFRIQGRRVAVFGHRNEAAQYALAMLAYAPAVVIATNGATPLWDARWQAYLQEYRVEVREERAVEIVHDDGYVRSIRFESGGSCESEALFATRGDVFHTRLAERLGAAEDGEGQLVVDGEMKTTVPGLYASGCVTPANCQMIIAAGQGAAAAQAINRDLFEDDLLHHALPVVRPDERSGYQGALPETAPRC